MSGKLRIDQSPEVLRLLQDILGYIDPNSVKVVLDVGSRDAKEAITMKEVFPIAKVYAFECNPAAIKLCEQNIDSLNDIILVPKAVSDVNGKVDFFAIDPEKTVTSRADGNIGASSLFIANPAFPYEKYSQTKITVDSIRLNGWAEEVGVRDIDILWIDLQGAELKAFQGMDTLLLRTKIIFTEVEFKEMYLGQPLFREVNRYLSANGFCLLKLYPADWFGNALYVRKDTVQGMKLAMLYVNKVYLLTLVKLWNWKRRLRNLLLKSGLYPIYKYFKR